MRIRSTRILAVVAVALCAACAGLGKGKSRGVEAMPPRPLAGLASQPLVVLPAHYLRTGDSIQWSTRIPDSKAYLAAFDSTLERTLKERGVPDSWKFPQELTRIAQRNAGYVSNPYQLSAQSLRPPSRGPQGQLTDPLASQLRAWAALNQARVVLLPVEIRFEGKRDSAQAVLRIAVIDARLSTISWMSEVRSDFGDSPIGMVLATLARQVADLVAQP